MVVSGHPTPLPGSAATWSAVQELERHWSVGHSRCDSLCVILCRAAWQTSTADPSLPVGAALCFSVWRLFDKRKKRAGDSDMGRSPIWGAVGVTLFGLILGSLVRPRSRGFDPGFNRSWWGALLAPSLFSVVLSSLARLPASGELYRVLGFIQGCSAPIQCGQFIGCEDCDGSLPELPLAPSPFGPLPACAATFDRMNKSAFAWDDASWRGLRQRRKYNESIRLRRYQRFIACTSVSKELR